LSLPVRQPLRALAIKTKDAKQSLDAELTQLVCEELNIKVSDDDLVDKASLHPEEIKVFPGANAVENIYLDVLLTPELKEEGIARELERHVQDLRKKSGLKIGEMVDLYYNTQEAELENILVNKVDRKKTFVNNIEKSFEVEVDYEIQAQVGGKPLWLGFVKIS
jgi:hypothetical protein